MHHTYTNISHYDSDFDFGLFARKTPFQQWHFCHSYQHYYIWILYGYYTIEWALFHDFSNLFSGKSIERLNSPKIKGTDLVIFMGGKAVFIYFTFGLPLTSHSFWNVLICYLVVAFTVGIVMNVVFLLAHEVQEATFSLPPENTDTIENAWAIHQTETCVNFPCNRFLSWFLGGLNFQIEHHLFPNICHVNYPMIAKIVEETCQEFDVKYKKHDSIWAGITSHFRLLRYLGESKENF